VLEKVLYGCLMLSIVSILTICTQFIKAAVPQYCQTVSSGLRSSTTKIREVKAFPPGRLDLDPVLFVDTPGFDDTHKSDKEILAMVANWLETA
jgi:hypothetical protein